MKKLKKLRKGASLSEIIKKTESAKNRKANQDKKAKALAEYKKYEGKF